MKRTIVCLILGAAAIAPPRSCRSGRWCCTSTASATSSAPGTLGPGESARLDFKAAEMNDVLKSLTSRREGRRQDHGPALRFAGPAEPEAGASFRSRSADAQSLAAMLDQLKGARIELKFGNETVGRRDRERPRWSPASDKQPEREQLTLLLDCGELRTLDLGAATGHSLHRSEAAAAVPRLPGGAGGGALEGQAQRVHRFDRRQGARGRGQLHDSDAGLEVELPADLRRGRASRCSKAGRSSTTRPARIGPMCSLSLVSGRPISFISQLYAPKYVQRPTAELPDDRRRGRWCIEAGSQAQKAVAGSAPGADRGGCSRRLPLPRPMLGAMAAHVAPAPLDAVVVAPSTIVSAAAAGRELGELFEYRIAQPVTIQQGRVGHAAVPAAADRRAQAADLFGPQLAASRPTRPS